MAAQTQSKITNRYNPYPKNGEGKKESVTNATYQSTFLPLFQNAETRIKELITSAFFLMKPLHILKGEIHKVLLETISKIPTDLPDRDNYIKGLTKSVDAMINTYYVKRVASFSAFLVIFNKVSTKKVKNPMEYYSIIKRKSDDEIIDLTNKMYNLKTERKGYPYIENYQKELKNYLNNLASQPVTTHESGKKPISMWQKAELDVRYNKQMDKLEELKEKGVEYAYISSHVDASERCAVWQGSLVALNKHAPSPQTQVKNFKYNKRSFICGELDGKKVYSLPDIMNVETEGGWHNNCICGFNCRHHLIPYEKGTVNPRQYSSQEIKQERLISTRLRQMERKIRELKNKSKVYAKAGDLKTAKALHNQAEYLIAQYKSYANKNGFAWYDYRIRV